MPKPRLSYVQAQVRGSEQVNSGRFSDRKDTAATVGSVGNAPKHLTAPEKKVWNELSAAIPAGIAGDSDRIGVEIATRLLHQFRTNPTAMPSSRIAVLMNLMSRLGLDPQARTKLHVPQLGKDAKPKDALDRYMASLNDKPDYIVQ